MLGLLALEAMTLHVFTPYSVHTDSKLNELAFTR